MGGKTTIGVVKEVLGGETRCAATPKTVSELIHLGFSVIVEEHAGDGAGIIDAEFGKAGATHGDQKKTYSADIVIGVNSPTVHQVEHLKEGALWISLIDIFSGAAALKKARDKNVSVLGLNFIPRISRAQKMDVLTSQSNIAGYKAVVMAANLLGKIFPLMMTAAGTMQPAKVVVLGAGVAGLQAIATAKRLGAVVEASDVRPAVKEQVESLGAKFIEVPFDKEAEDKGGYAKGASPEFLKRQAAEVSKRIAQADVVICTALVPGKKAPILVTAEMVHAMHPGAVIVDMAAAQGGNCALTRPGMTTETKGVSIIGVENIPATVPAHATDMFAKNVAALLSIMVRENEFALDFSDEIIKASVIIHEGAATNDLVAKELGGNA